jgi:hypothetical protein
VNEICVGTRGMGAAAQIPQAVQPLDGQRQASEQPSDQQAVGVMMADMFEVVAIFGIIKLATHNQPSFDTLAFPSPQFWVRLDIYNKSKPAPKTVM